MTIHDLYPASRIGLVREQVGAAGLDAQPEPAAAGPTLAIVADRADLLDEPDQVPEGGFGAAVVEARVGDRLAEHHVNRAAVDRRADGDADRRDDLVAIGIDDCARGRAAVDEQHT